VANAYVIAPRRTEFDFLGQRYVLPAGEPYVVPFDDPCLAFEFIVAGYEASGETEGITNEAPNALQDLHDACVNQQAEGNPPADAPAPPAPPVQPDPSATGPDVPPPMDGETAESLGAPAVESGGVKVGVVGPEPGPSDGRTLAQQYHDHANPKPDFDISDLLGAQGVPPDQIAIELEKVRRNEAPRGRRHPDFARGERTDTQTASDPVSVFDGAFTLTVTDVMIATVGFPLQLVRTYRSGRVMFGPWGYNWDHNYNAYVRRLDDGSLAVWTAQFAEEIYAPAPGGGFESPLGSFRRIESLPGLPGEPDRLVLTEAGGQRLVFGVPPGWPWPDRIPLLSIEDRHGNAHSLIYDAEGRLSRVENGAERFIAFSYGDCGLLEHVFDHAGRNWLYRHDPTAEHLVEFTSPATTDHAEGCTTRYDYDSDRQHPALRHNLVRVFDGEGRLVVENWYGDDPGAYDFGRIVRQETCGSETRFSATELQYVPHRADTVNVPERRVEVLESGVLNVLTFNWRGDVLDHRFRLVRDGSFRLVATISRYDPQGNLAERYEPNGHGYLYIWDHDNADPTARGNLLRVVELASPLAPAPSREVFRATYEPRYQLPKTYREAGGALTEWVYDHEGQPPGAGSGRLTELRRPVITLPDGTVHQSVERFDFGANGQIRRHEVGAAIHTFEYDAQGYLSERRHEVAGLSIIEQYEHDAIGNMIARIDGVGNRMAYAVNARSQTEEVTTPDGAVWRFHYDAAGQLARSEEPRGEAVDPALVEPVIVNEFRLDTRGELVELVLAANTSVPRRYRYRRSADDALFETADAIGRVLRQRRDERGLVLEETLLDTDGATVVQRRRFTYERTGRLRQIRTDGVPAALNITYDGFDAVRSLTAADGSTLRYTHDDRGLLTAAEITGSDGRLLARRCWDLDERGRVRWRIEDLFTDPAAQVLEVVTALWLDDSGLPLRIDAPGGLVVERVYSATGSLMEERDSLGNRMTWILDAADRPTQLVVVEQPDVGAPVSYVTVYEFDARGRQTSERDPLGNTINVEYDERNMPVRAANQLGAVLVQRFDVHDQLIEVLNGGTSMRYLRDAANRVLKVIDPAAAAAGMRYDWRDRLTEVQRPDGRVQSFAYDPTGALARLVDFDGTEVVFTNNALGLPERIESQPAPGVMAVAPVQLIYDGLRRIVRATAGPVAHEFQYDSLSRLLAEIGPDIVMHELDPAGAQHRLTYPDSRRETFHYDPLGRLRTVTLANDGALDLANAGFRAGDVLAEWNWAGASLPARTALPGGSLSCEYPYDGAQRTAGRRYVAADGSEVFADAHVRDRLGRLRVRHRAAPARLAEEYRYDDLTRLTLARLGLPDAVAPPDTAGLTQTEMDVIVAAASGAPASAQVRLSFLDSGLINTREDLDGGGAVAGVRTFTAGPNHELSTVDGVSVSYDAAGNLTRWGSREFVYDAFRRLVEVRDGGVTVGAFGYDGLGRLHTQLLGSDPAVRFAYAADELIQVTGPAGPIAQFLPGIELDQPVLASLASGNHYVPVYDSTGSMTAICGLSGVVEERYRYDLFGLPSVFAPDGVTPRPEPTLGMSPRFTGRPWLAACGLYDFRNRHYDPQLFVFLQPDPVLFANSWCPYTFLGHNLVDSTDPFGTWVTIVVGGVAGAAIGGVAAALSGGDTADILVGIGAGAVGGAFAGAGLPVVGASVSGGLMGGWSGGRIGYDIAGAEGAVAGVIGGGLAGAALGAIGGFIGSRIGNVTGTAVYGAIYRHLTARGVGVTTATTISRYSGQIVGGYAGGASAGIVTSNTAALTVDAVTGQGLDVPPLWDSTMHALTIDGPLNAVGAAASRRAWLGLLPGNRSNVLGAEGEGLVGLRYNLRPAKGSETITINGRDREPDFRTAETLRRFRAVFEVKNKAKLSTRDITQIEDFADFAALPPPNPPPGWRTPDLVVFERPGAALSGQVTGIANIRWLPIPQLPLVVNVPPLPTRREPSK
jgi:RHS repeat-associated protein